MTERKRGWMFWLCATILLVIWLLPILASVLTSLKTMDELNSGAYWTWPKNLSFGNYTEAFVNGNFSKYFVNSMLVTIPSVILTLFLASMNGYAIAKIKGYRKVVYLFVVGMLLPFQILLIPVFYLSHHVLHTYDTLLGLGLFHVAFQLGFSSFFMSNFTASLPQSIIEAARMDGCSEWKIYWRIVLPLLTPALAALATLLFTWIWNDYLWALILIQSDDLKPITAGLQNLRGRWVSSYHLQSAGSLIAAIPPVLVFSLLQKHFIRGLTMGAVK